jgi:hypothetical protein
MPIHDWTRVPAGLFHHFHQDWTIEIARRLNRGLLPKGLSALVEQRSALKEPDVLTVERITKAKRAGKAKREALLTLKRPTAKIVRRTTNEIYAGRANRIVVKHHLGRIVAVIEIMSPGNKDSRAALRDFVDKAIAFLRNGIHLLVVDLFPPTPRDPYGMHKVIWDEILEEEFAFPPGKDRLVVSHETGGEQVAYVEPLAVADALPAMPLFLASSTHIRVPLEATYDAAWDASPEEMRTAVETGILPEREES